MDRCCPGSSPTGSRSLGGLFTSLVSEVTWATTSGHPSGSSARLGRCTRGPATQLSCKSTAGPLVMHWSAWVASGNAVGTRPWSRWRPYAVLWSLDSEQFEWLHPLRPGSRRGIFFLLIISVIMYSVVQSKFWKIYHNSIFWLNSKICKKKYSEMCRGKIFYRL